MYQVAIVVEHPISRAGMEKLASDESGMHVVAAVESVEELQDHGGRYDMVVLDLPQMTSAALDTVAKAAAAGPTLVSSVWDGSPSLLATVRAGARGCVSRLAEQRDVREAMRVTTQGGFYLCPRMVGKFQVELANAGAEEQSGLAPREIETLRFIASGYTHSQIATRMGLSQATVNTYAKRIRAKLNVNNKADLTRMAIELGHFSQGRRSSSAA
ncbi:response regulator transcription factor [Actinoplanes sp. NPDC049265]|uniref:response regulator transcription factor n=1 Tax=Actinoplanes sp. NPDC049265 TaxID=3363902 RepID=UPI00371BE6E5